MRTSLGLLFRESPAAKRIDKGETACLHEALEHPLQGIFCENQVQTLPQSDRTIFIVTTFLYLSHTTVHPTPRVKDNFCC
jgi:hypothetical protein